MLEARTYSPVARDAMEVSLCGDFAEVSLPAADFAAAQAFWEPLGFVAAEEAEKPYPQTWERDSSACAPWASRPGRRRRRCAPTPAARCWMRPAAPRCCCWKPKTERVVRAVPAGPQVMHVVAILKQLPDNHQ